MKSLKHFLLLVIFAIPAIAFAQTTTNPTYDEYCGTISTPNRDAILDKNLKKMRSGNYLRSNVVRYAPMSVHLVADNNGNGRFSDVTMLDRMCELNQQMEQSDIQFFLADGDGIYKYDNDAWHTGTGFALMVLSTKKTNSLNLYFQNVSKNPGSGQTVCGFYSPQHDVMSVQHSCMGAGNKTAVHEFGHLFTLDHTFKGQEGLPLYSCGTTATTVMEKTDGSNCAAVADRFCDTGPDYINDRWNCNSQFQSNCEHVDANGVSFFPSGKNIMSYSNDNCANEFTNEQTAAMHINYDDDRMDIHPTGTVSANEIVDALALSEPADNGTVGFSTIELRWFAVQHATRYIVQISNSPSFGGSSIVHTEIVNGTELIYNGSLTQFTTYHWRVRPFSDFYFCTDFSDSRAFVTNDQQVSNTEIDGVHTVKLFPNPANSGTSVSIELHAEKSMEANIKIFSVQGKLVSSLPVSINNNQNRFEIPTENLTSGIYVISLETNLGTIQKKLVINK